MPVADREEKNLQETEQQNYFGDQNVFAKNAFEIKIFQCQKVIKSEGGK